MNGARRPHKLELEGRLVVLAEDDAALVAVGDEFLDDALRRRFATYHQNNRDATVVPHVRVVVEEVEHGERRDNHSAKG